MKILNKTHRDISPGECQMETTPISELTVTNDLPDGSLIHVARCEGRGIYESRKMTTDAFKQKIYESVQNTFKTRYWETHDRSHGSGETGSRPDGSSFSDFLAYLKSKGSAPVGVPDDAVDGFIKHVYYDFDLIKRYVVLRDSDMEDTISGIGDRMDALDCGFSPVMDWTTTGLDNNGTEVNITNSTDPAWRGTENDDQCQMSIESGNKISSEWECPSSGNLVIYGWLDSSACLNNKATPSAFCAIEGNINDAWETIAVCPVSPAKSIAYVGFNLVVRKGLVIRARTGFTCGAKSGGYSNQQDGYDTLANSKANGFMCTIYSNGRESPNDNT